MTDDEIAEIIQLVRDEIDRLSEEAANLGYANGGQEARELSNALRFYQMGMGRCLPREWRRLVERTDD